MLRANKGCDEKSDIWFVNVKPAIALGSVTICRPGVHVPCGNEQTEISGVCVSNLYRLCFNLHLLAELQTSPAVV